MRPRLAALLAGLLAVAVLLACACAPRSATLLPDSVSGAPDRDGLSLVAAVPAAPPIASLFEITYATPSGEVFRRCLDALSLGYVPDVALGRGAAVRAIAGTSSVVVDDAGMTAIVNGLGEREVIARHGRALPFVAATPDGSLWIGDGARITVADADGRVLSALETPAATSGSRVSGLAFDGLRSLVAMSSPASSALLDVADHRLVELDGIAPILDVATWLGHAYVLGVDTTEARGPLRLLDVDLATFAVARTTSLPVDRRSGVDGQRILATAGGPYVYVAVAKGVHERSLLFWLDPDFAASPLALPDDLGVDAVTGVDDALYLFGGPAGNVVTRVDPASAALTRYVAAPDATVVRALAVR